VDQFPRGVRIFVDSEMSKPALQSTYLPIQLAMGAVSLKRKQPECEVTTHLHPVLRLGMIGAIPPLPHMPAWNAHG
jgi:hypothetical protein